MQTSETESRFDAMLHEAGFNGKAPNPALAWSVFKAFSCEPVECVREALLVEFGNFYPGEGLFPLTLVREFWVVENGEEYCEQLHCDFTCPPHQNLPDKQTFLLSYDFERVEDYFAAVELLKSFKAAMRHPVEQWQSDISQFVQ